MRSVKGFENAVAKLSKLPTATNRLSTADFEQADGTASERSRVATRQVNRPVAIKDGDTFDVDFMAYESFTTDGTGGNTETFSLSHDLVDSVSVAEDFILYEGGARQSADAVNYSGNSFDYTDDGTNNTLHVFYVAGDQATLEVRKTAPNGVYETLAEYDIGLVNVRNRNKEPLRFDADHPLQGVIPTDWSLDFYVDAPYTVSWGVDVDGDGTDEAEPLEQLVSIPIHRSERNVPGDVEGVIRQVAAVQ